MHNFIELVKEEVPQLENALKQVDEFLENVPQGSLKWQNKNGKTYYYHQFMQNNKWVRRYIKKAELSLAKTLAQKQYYISIRPILERMLDEIERFIKKCPLNELEKIYDNLSVERKNLVTPIQVSVKEKVKQWENEVYEKNLMYHENLRFETEKGDTVRSKSEVIIANILYRNRKDILYKYERPLEVIENGRQKTIYPDFTILKKKDFEYITIKEICEKAGVNRSTFYLHYENTADLLREATQYIMDGFLTYFSVDHKEITFNFESSDLNELLLITPQYILPYLTYMKENQRVFRTSLKHLGTMNFDIVYEKMFRYIFNPILERFSFPENERKYIMKFYLTGITAIVFEWISKECEESIEDMGRIIWKCVIDKANLDDEKIKLLLTKLN